MPATAPDNISLGIKKPKRIIHFSDGVLEEYSSDEEDEGKKAVAEPAVDPVSLTEMGHKTKLPFELNKTPAAPEDTDQTKTGINIQISHILLFHFFSYSTLATIT